MAKNYSYPRVTMSTVAKKHSHNRVSVPDTTVMFAPLVTEKGPDDRLVKVHSLEEFISIFGSLNKDFYELNGQMALNVYNWLNNGGTLFVKRLVVSNEKALYNETNGSGNKIVSLKTTLNKDANVPIFDSSELNERKLLEQLLTNDVILVLNNLSSIKMDENHIIDLGELSASKYGENNENEFYFYIKEDSSENTLNTYELVLTTEEMEIVTSLTSSDGTYGYNSSTSLYERVNDGATLTLSNEKILEVAGDNKVFSKNGKYIVKQFKSAHTEPCSTCMTVATVVATDVEYAIQARYHGDYYNDLIFVVEPCSTEKYFNFKIYKKTISGRPLEQFLSIEETKALAALSSSEYIEIINGENFVNFLVSLSKDSDNIECPLVGTTHNKTYSNIINDVLKNFWNNEVKTLLANRLETPVDILFDAGYPYSIKKAMYDLVSNHGTDPLRPDIILILDRFVLNEKLKLNPPSDALVAGETLTGETFAEGFDYGTTNVAYYEQYFTINEPTFADQDIYVTPTYFLSKLFIYNDLTYGIQYPTAGLRRAELEDAIWMNKNPDADQKEAWFQKRHNYAEKTSRETAFMSQRVVDGSNDYDYTALSFLNNNRVLEKMKKELEFIGRSYLHEFNDAITIANMSVALNKYVANWIANRTLSLGTVEVVQNEVSENALDINLTIRFTNTIEVINVSIVIE